MKFEGFWNYDDAKDYCRLQTDSNARSFGVWKGSGIYIVTDVFDYCNKHFGDAVYVGF